MINNRKPAYTTTRKSLSAIAGKYEESDDRNKSNDPLESVKVLHVNYIATVVFFKRLRNRQNVFTSRRLLAQKNDQSGHYKLCEYEIQASSLLSVQFCIIRLIERYFELS